ncbi:MAG: phosphoglycerate kinase [Acidimicrobiaceae bacterium]|nr:phosphoglycerate kinase [Acidimicrobiaceae bacterium]MCY4279619.1 phosphoglycerate kinase [Acidimicrobiaceae bacterium]MCY4295136.1 phosphoglycerate kinase [Acidimicrobiaceae bacterium]
MTDPAVVTSRHQTQPSQEQPILTGGQSGGQHVDLSGGPRGGLPCLEDLGPLEGRSVLLRVDFNVPLSRDAAGAVEISDDLRIRAALPTLRWLQRQGASVTACTHLGRPAGKPEQRFSVAPVRRRLQELAPGVELLENLRFSPGETADDPAFAAELTAGHDLYVNDAFGASHRAHASIVGPPRSLPSAAGRLLAREVEVLNGLRRSPRRPFVAVLGGAKVSDKLGVIDALLEMVDALVIGGAMCFTFLAARGRRVGASLCEDSMVQHCQRLLDGDTSIHLPEDLTVLGPGGVLGDPDAGGEVRQAGADVPDGWTGTDIGPGTAAAFGDVIHEAGTVLWNGPMGVFEDPRFVGGTGAVAAAMAETRAFTVVGGGDSAAAARRFGIERDVDHVSTGGGAALELIEKGDLPGLAALRDSSL